MAKVRAVTVHTAMLSRLEQMKDINANITNLGEEAKAEAIEKFTRLFDEIDSFYDQSVTWKTHMIWQEALLLDLNLPSETYELEEDIA